MQDSIKLRVFYNFYLKIFYFYESKSGFIIAPITVEKTSDNTPAAVSTFA